MGYLKKEKRSGCNETGTWDCGEKIFGAQRKLVVGMGVYERAGDCGEQAGAGFSAYW